MLNFLVDKETTKENVIMYVKNIDTSRFRAIFREFQAQTSVPAVIVDFKAHSYTFSDLETAITEGRGSFNRYRDKIVYFLIENLQNFDHVTALENIFLTYNSSLIMSSFPENLLQLSSLGKWTQLYNFEGNYIAQVLENHPPRLVEICSKYRTIDYPFYVMSQTEPLADLCTKLPTNGVTECIRTHLQKPEDRVPFSKVRKCFKDDPLAHEVDGVIFENGMVGIKKDYFYAGKIDRSVFGFENSENL